MERNKKGQFIKGKHYSRKTEFKKGKHWRPSKPFWEKEWLNREYAQKNKSAGEIANQFNITEAAIFFWLRKHQIKRRSMSEIRKKKYWGLSGKVNGMYGITGSKSPNWRGGGTPERQAAYTKFAWKELAKSILKRDNYKCQKCRVGHIKGNKLVVHHIKGWAKYSDLRFEPTNLLTLCEKCHKIIHKNRNL